MSQICRLCGHVTNAEIKPIFAGETITLIDDVRTFVRIEVQATDSTVIDAINSSVPTNEPEVGNQISGLKVEPAYQEIPTEKLVQVAREETERGANIKTENLVNFLPEAVLVPELAALPQEAEEFNLANDCERALQIKEEFAAVNVEKETIYESQPPGETNEATETDLPGLETEDVAASEVATKEEAVPELTEPFASDSIGLDCMTASEHGQETNTPVSPLSRSASRCSKENSLSDSDNAASEPVLHLEEDSIPDSDNSQFELNWDSDSDCGARDINSSVGTEGSDLRSNTDSDYDCDARDINSSVGTEGSDLRSNLDSDSDSDARDINSSLETDDLRLNSDSDGCSKNSSLVTVSDSEDCCSITSLESDSKSGFECCQEPSPTTSPTKKRKHGPNFKPSQLGVPAINMAGRSENHGLATAVNVATRQGLGTRSASNTAGRSENHGLATAVDVATRQGLGTRSASNTAGRSENHGLATAVDVATRQGLGTRSASNTAGRSENHGLATAVNVATRQGLGTRSASNTAGRSENHGLATAVDVATRQGLGTRSASNTAGRSENHCHVIRDCVVMLERLPSHVLNHLACHRENFNPIATDNGVPRKRLHTRSASNTECRLDNLDPTTTDNVVPRKRLRTRSASNTECRPENLDPTTADIGVPRKRLRSWTAKATPPHEAPPIAPSIETHGASPITPLISCKQSIPNEDDQRKKIRLDCKGEDQTSLQWKAKDKKGKFGTVKMPHINGNFILSSKAKHVAENVNAKAETNSEEERAEKSNLRQNLCQAVHEEGCVLGVPCGFCTQSQSQLPYRCWECNRVFAKGPKLIRHFRKHLRATLARHSP